MAATGSRTLKLSILADVENLTKNLKSGSKDVESFADKMGDFGRKAAIAFAAAGAAIGAFAIASVKAAAEDETAQRKLSETLRATTDATTTQIAGIDKYITAQSIATATTDDEIRPALSRLATATGDLTKAQELLSLAQEISSATGKPLEAVANALAKSFDGSSTALGKLGLTLSAADLQTMSHEEAIKSLTGTYSGFIANEATTAEFKFRQISIATNEAKEAIGAALLPIVTKLADYLIQTVVPNMELFIAALTGESGIVDGIDKSGEAAYQWGGQVRGLIKTVIDLKDELQVVAAIIAAMWVTSKIFAFVTAIQGLIATMILLRTTAIGTAIAAAFATGGANIALATAALLAVGLTGYNLMNLTGGDSTDSGFGGSGLGKNPIQSGTYLNTPTSRTVFDPKTNTFVPAPNSVGGATVSTNAATSLKDLVGKLEGVSEKIGEITFLFESGALSKSQTSKLLDVQIKQFDLLTKQAENLGAVESTSTFNPGSFRRGEAATMINVTVNGAIDSEGTARTVVNTLNDSFYRGTLGAGALVGAFDK